MVHGRRFCFNLIFIKERISSRRRTRPLRFMNDEGETTMKILIVEDEPKIAGALKEGLEFQGFDVILAATGEEGFFLAQSQAHDLMVLDLMLPGRDGIEILKAMRQCGIKTPVLILTARDTVDERVQGLECGADDYLVKPFAFPELVARIRALLRRGRIDQAVRLSLADLEMDLLTHRVTRGGQPLDLTGKEFDLLECLLRNQGRIVSREMLAHEVWGEQVRASSLDNVIDVFINRLRKRVDQAASARLIHTIRGVGFMLREEGP
jgi:two-component system, OmpR family, copper resistance phosphate regulon response regulator CusR